MKGKDAKALHLSLHNIKIAKAYREYLQFGNDALTTPPITAGARAVLRAFTTLGALTSVAFALAGVSTAAVTTPAARTTPAPPRVAPFNGLCDGTAVLDVLGDLGDSSSAKARDQIALLQGRILNCSRRIAAARAAAASAPTPYWQRRFDAFAAAGPRRSAAGNDRIEPSCALRSAAALCGIRRIDERRGVTRTGGERPSSISAHPTFYVFAVVAVDASTATVLDRATTAQLSAFARRAAASAAGGDMVLSGRADWTSIVPSPPNVSSIRIRAARR